VSIYLDSTACISNLTKGGGVVYKDNLFKEITLNKDQYFSPRKFIESKIKFLNIIYYLKHVYFDLLIDYYKIAKKINNDKQIAKVIIFQDSYLKAPYVLAFLKPRTIYILHEPPREFYEPNYYHSPTLGNKLFNILIRYPIKYIDKYLTSKANVIVCNSEYSKKTIKNIYNKESVLIYPGVNINRTKSEFNKKRNWVCISVGSLLPYKGNKEAILVLSKTKVKPKLIIVGNGNEQEKENLYNFAKDNSVEIKIISNISDVELKKEYSRSKIYINCAYKEPFGISALEAITNGCLLVTNKLGGTKELKKYFIKSVYISKNNDSMSKIIDTLYNKENVIPKIVDEFKWKSIANKIVNL
jgi:hypothetical protein